MAPDFERLARMPWPIASLASSGISAFSSAFERSWSRKACRVAEQTGKFRPGVRGAHVDNPNRFDPGLWWLDTKQARGLAALDTAPELRSAVTMRCW